MGNDLVLLAVSTPFYVIRYPSTHSYPVMRLARFSNGFVSSRMSSCGVIVYKSHQLLFGRFGGSRDDPFNEQFWFEECLVFVIILTLIDIRWSGEFVCWGVNLSRDVFDYEIVFL